MRALTICILPCLFAVVACVDDYPRPSLSASENVSFLACESEVATDVRVTSWDPEGRVLRIAVDGAPLGTRARFITDLDKGELTVFYQPLDSQPCEDPFETQIEIVVRDVPESLGASFALNLTYGVAVPDYANVLRVNVPVGR